MKNIIFVLSIFLFSCNSSTVKTTPSINCDSLISAIDSVHKIQQEKYKKIMLEYDKQCAEDNNIEYFLVVWSSGNSNNIILINNKHYNYVIKEMDDSRNVGELDRDRLNRLSDFIYNNKIKLIEVNSYDKSLYDLNNYNIVKIISFPEMMLKY